MAEGEDKDSKTEEPTEKKIRDAVDKGNVPFSREVPVFASTLGMLVFLVFFLPSSAARFTETLRDLFEQSDGWRLTTGGDAMALFQLLFFEAGGILLPAFALLMGFGIAASVLQNMPSPVLDRIQPKLERISIIKGFGGSTAPRAWWNSPRTSSRSWWSRLSWQWSCRRNSTARSISCSWTRSWSHWTWLAFPAR
jgi:flagellar biosynthetic protein FlhB